jgi:hypothetical protein
MRGPSALIALFAILSMPASAQGLGNEDSGSASSTARTDQRDTIPASVAQNAHYIYLADQGGYLIDRINVGPGDRLVSVTIDYNSRWVDIPGRSIVAGDEPGSLKTSLTSEDLKKL